MAAELVDYIPRVMIKSALFQHISNGSVRVSKADDDDWKKLGCLLTYIKNTIDLDLTLSANAMTVIKWWCDAAYAVRADFKSQTGSTMSMGRGTIISKSGKQKLKTKSSTEAELVSTSHTVPQMIWTNYFLESQGFIIDHATILYQDNKSAMLMERNDKFSSGKQTKKSIFDTSLLKIKLLLAK